MKKLKNVDISNDVLLVTADTVGLYPSVPHEVGLKYLLKTLLKWQSLYYKTITLNLIVVFFNKFRVLL